MDSSTLNAPEAVCPDYAIVIVLQSAVKSTNWYNQESRGINAYRKGISLRNPGGRTSDNGTHQMVAFLANS